LTAPDTWRSLFAITGDGLLEVNADGFIAGANPALLRWLNLPRESVVGQHLRSLADLPDPFPWAGARPTWTGNVRMHGAYRSRTFSATVTRIAAGQTVAVVRKLPDGGLMADEMMSKMDELDTTQLVMINTIARLAEIHDQDIGGHLERVRLYTFTLAQQIRDDDSDGLDMSEQQVIELSRSAVLHDVGKIVVPSQILAKPGALTAEERAIMQRHTTYGGEFLRVADDELQRLLGVSETFLSNARDAALYHHEKYDGTGYPHGLAGGEIPLIARVVALADFYDALTSSRAYKDAWSHERVRDMITKASGCHFDPKVVEAFLATEEIIVSLSGTMHAGE